MKAAIYSRKSKFTGKGESIENQVQLCMDHAKNLGITEFLVYEDEGFSGKTIDRPQFKKLLQDAKNKKFDYLICYRLDRISRNVSDFSTLIENLNKLEISFISIKEQFDTSTPMGRAMMYISSVFAQLERETIAERVKDNMYELARTGRWLGGMPPYGFNSTQLTYIDENMVQRKMCKLEINEENMTIVKLIFEKYSEFRSLTKLFKYMNENNIKGTRGGNLDPSSLSSILKSPAYVKANEKVMEYLRSIKMNTIGTPDGKHGILAYAKNTTSPIAAVAAHEGVIDAEIWLSVQTILNSNKDKAPRAGTGNKSLLTGLLKCSKCNSNMRVSYKNNSTGTIIYYVCGKKKTFGVSACNCKNIRADKLEELVIDQIKKQNTNAIKDEYNAAKSKNNKDSNDISNNIDILKNNIKDKEGLVDTLIMQLARLTESSASNLIVSKLEKMNNEILELKVQLENLENTSTSMINTDMSLDILIDNLNKFNIEIETSDLDKKRLLLSTIIDNIIFDGDNETITINYLGISSISKFSDDIGEDYNELHFNTDSRSYMYQSATKERLFFYLNTVDESTFGSRLKLLRSKENLSIRDLAQLAEVTECIISGYETGRYFPSKSILDKLSSIFDMDYLCRDGYSNLVYNFDSFIDKLISYRKENNLSRKELGKILGVSPPLISCWMDGSIIRLNTFEKIKDKLSKHKLL